jgi:hypothetical protein
MEVKMEPKFEEIRQRADKATPGPWYAGHDYREGGANQILYHSGLTVCFMSHDSSGLVDEFDTEFIAHARQDIPTLLDEIARLEEQVDDLEHERKDNDALLWKVAEQQKEIERLKQQLTLARNWLSSINSAWGVEDEIWDNLDKKDGEG